MMTTPILDRIKEAGNLKTDVELAEFLGIKKGTLAGWRYRGSVDFEVVIDRCRDLVNLDWLFLWRGKKYPPGLIWADGERGAPVLADELQIPVIGEDLTSILFDPQDPDRPRDIVTRDAVSSHGDFLRHWLTHNTDGDPDKMFMSVVKGMAMSPLIVGGDLVIGERVDSISWPGPYLFWLDGQVQARHVVQNSSGGHDLVPHDAGHTTIERTADWELIGEVRAVLGSTRSRPYAWLPPDNKR